MLGLGTVAELIQDYTNGIAWQLLEENSPSAVEGILFHYTSLPGFIGIVESGSIWASDARYLNDPTEKLYADRLIREAIDRVIKSGCNRSLANYLRDMHAGFLRVDAEWTFYFCSFSQRGNLLSQWIAYTPGAVGVAIGIDGALAARQSEFMLRKVLYDPYRQRKLIDDLLRLYFAPLSRALATRNDGETITLGHLLSISLQLCRLFFKDPSYAMEEEWRLFSLRQDEGTRASHSVRYRAVGRTIIPYVQFPIREYGSDGQGALAIVQVILGPGVDATCGRSVQSLLQAEGLSVQPSESGLPFRNVR